MQTSPPSTPGTIIFFRNVILKALVLFAICNLGFAAFRPLDNWGQLSAYNHIFVGRARLPYGERPDLAYNLSLDNLPAMLAAHEIHAAAKMEDEFKVVIVGDSSVWGYLLTPDQTLSSQMNQANLQMADGRNVHVYNLGYPTISITKDILFIQQALRYQPDLIIWLTTLEAFPMEKQLDSPIVQNNPSAVRSLIQEFNLPLDGNDARFKKTSFWSQTIIGQRRALADLLRLQIYGILWAASGVDQYYPVDYEPPQHDLDNDSTFHTLIPPSLEAKDLAFSIVEAGIDLAGMNRLLIVNEPIYISDGENSDVRYNFFYPRWAYDQYRQILKQTCQENNWDYMDAWDLIPAQEFTNSAIHLSPEGTTLLAKRIIAKVTEMIDTVEISK